MTGLCSSRVLSTQCKVQAMGERVNEVTEARKTIMRVFFVTLWKKENRNKVSTKWRLWRTYSFIILNKVQTSCYLIVKFQNESIWYSTFKHSFSSDNNPPNLVELTDEFKMKVLINSKQSLNNIICETEQLKIFYCQIMLVLAVFFVFRWVAEFMKLHPISIMCVVSSLYMMSSLFVKG